MKGFKLLEFFNSPGYSDMRGGRHSVSVNYSVIESPSMRGLMS